jgi:hypothetical protein
MILLHGYEFDVTVRCHSCERKRGLFYYHTIKELLDKYAERGLK